MEPPTAITPFSEDYHNSEKTNFIVKLVVPNNNKEYTIQFGIEDNYQKSLVIKVSSPHEIYYFLNKYTLEEIHALSNVFKIYNNIEKIISVFSDLSYEIFENEDKLLLKFYISFPTGEKRLIKLDDLQKNFLDSKSIINNLIEENKILKQRISHNENEIKLLKEENKKLWKEINNLNNNYSQNPNQNINNLSDLNQVSSDIYSSKKDLNFGHSFESRIINSINDIDFIFNHIRKKDPLNYFSKINLLYRASRDGDRTEKCHKLCDNKENIIILIKSNYGYTFGGYCKIGFKTTKIELEPKIDNNSFIFSVDSKKIYSPSKNRKIIVYANNNYGLCFFKCLGFYDNFLTKNNSFVCEEGSEKILENPPSNKEINGGKKKFKCQELEVFQIL